MERPIDSFQQTALRFGDRSHWLQPWRAYLDTVPAPTLEAAVGINFNVSPANAAATAKLLGESGFRRARLELGWSDIDYSDRSRLLPWKDEEFRARLAALRDNGLRPLILLNAHHGVPGPHQFFSARLVEPAEAGARTIRVNTATAQRIVPGRTGLNATDQYKAADILFTRVEADGVVTLSKPLPRRLEPGDHPAATLGFAPFERPRLADGAPNPAFEETMAGWLQYVDVVTRRTREILGSTEFDVEVWNELTFGSDFLDATRYYEPPPDIGVGDTNRVILERTLAFIRDPAHGLEGVGTGDGFANQAPWAAGSTSPPGLTAIDKHPYKGLVRFPGGEVNPNQRPIDAYGRPNGTELRPDEWREDFVPTYGAFFPEYYLSAIQTEHLVRDFSPITTELFGTSHGRYAHPPGSPPPEVWITETGMEFGEAGLGASQAAHLRAKATLRATLAFVNKGVRALCFYAAQGAEFGLVDQAFFDQVSADGGSYPGAASGGATMAAMSRMMDRFESPGTLETRRELSLLRISDDHDQRQFDGDGTSGHPPLFNRDILAFLPFQLTANRFVAGVYVMTRDLTTVHRADLPPTDPARFDLAPANYRLTIANLGGQELEASGYDPLTDEQIPVEVVSRGSDRAVIELPVTDSPRLLVLEDSGPPPPAHQQAPPANTLPPPAGNELAPVSATSPAPARSGQARVTSVRRRKHRVLISGDAARMRAVRLVVRLGRGHVIRRRVKTVGGRFRVALHLPRSIRSLGGLRRVRVVARISGQAHESRWRI